jgi:hypothetical protein
LAFDQRPPPSEVVETALAKARDLDSWIGTKLRGVALKGDHKHRIPAQLFDLAIEHHAGTVELLSSRLYASGFALVRCAFECFVRGAWLHHCATNGEIETFVEKDAVPKIGPMIEALERKEEFAGGFLSKWKQDGWNAMNGYTHGGIHQVSRRMQGKYIEPSFEDEALLEAIRFTGTMAILALGQIAAIAGNQELWKEAETKMGEL